MRSAILLGLVGAVRPLVFLAFVGPAVASVAAGQGKNPKCGDAYHYRWKQKTDASLANEPATSATLTEVVNTWAAPALPANDWCAERVGDELHVYSFVGWRSEEHTSELQSQSNLVCRLLLEKKKKKNTHTHYINHEHIQLSYHC